MIRLFRCGLVLITMSLALASAAHAGMPAILPSDWTIDHPHRQEGSADEKSFALAGYVEAFSFFTAVVLASAWVVQRLVRVLRKDLRFLPELTYGRSLSFVVLWGLLFVVVLTMISGARELMTPGAWRKQGWTYRLADSPAASANTQRDERARRKAALESLRTVLWQYAATHEGQFPAPDDSSLEPSLWQIPGWPGLMFLTVPNRHAEESGRLLVYEPELDGNERQVLLTNGLIGTMTSAEIQAALKKTDSP